MTSRKKIHAIAKAAKTLSCAVVLKTGRPPGVMIAECEYGDEKQDVDGQGKVDNGKKRIAREGEERLREWVSAVKVCVCEKYILSLLRTSSCGAQMLKWSFFSEVFSDQSLPKRPPFDFRLKALQSFPSLP